MSPEAYPCIQWRNYKSTFPETILTNVHWMSPVQQTILIKTYKHQIAYTPRVSGSGQAGIETPWINLSYAFLFSGKRYTQGENISQNRLDGYSDHSLSASRNLKYAI